MNIVTGGLDALEVIGRKTVDIISEGDPGNTIELFYYRIPTSEKVLCIEAFFIWRLKHTVNCLSRETIRVFYIGVSFMQLCRKYSFGKQWLICMWRLNYNSKLTP